ncbi:Transcription elongation factor B polypeptide 1 [Grifola frondosa]|uniref:Elongin-C n=1 Tax=Grifola frondosa TaxID=5627 RepID=A0A1C7ML07_GRIFR|nr:Transcription elongation factor B polypeptide 1 [Grifola frondosa]
MQVDSDSKNEWVRLTSNDGYTFLVRRKVANGSGTLKNMLSSESNFAEAVSNTCPMEDRSAVVEKLCEYLVYKNIYSGGPAKEEIPDFTERLSPEIALELLMAADYYEA